MAFATFRMVCFHCREPGHQIAKCPALLNDTEQGTGICFKCGSTEHKVNECSTKITDFPFAKCFICKKQGHLSRNCPDNPKGLYPNGGCCKQCGKLDHLKKDCPELKEMEGVSEMLLPTMKTSVSADAEIDEYFQEKKHRHKVIKF
ncbi:zinc finger CCHC domain-containing protein 9-like [Centruroides sculpturatus]|uniref:zinc finger CCHC domain-containing protein 9-like n=1 Tax=Centruroides sculpturatus TaxID=218467 RepID=UPI000C6D671D|nr:zinc finger CCHC domain-containing protein 9-like [Centruroides sculpturatus]